jgi:hypothetical protein
MSYSETQVKTAHRHERMICMQGCAGDCHWRPKPRFRTGLSTRNMKDHIFRITLNLCGMRHEIFYFQHWGRGFESYWTHGCIYVYPFFFLFVLPCVGNGVATGWDHIQGVLLTVPKIHNFRLILNGTGPECLIHKEEELYKIFVIT